MNKPLIYWSITICCQILWNKTELSVPERRVLLCPHQIQHTGLIAFVVFITRTDSTYLSLWPLVRLLWFTSSSSSKLLSSFKLWTRFVWVRLTLKTAVFNQIFGLNYFWKVVTNVQTKCRRRKKLIRLWQKTATSSLMKCIWQNGIYFVRKNNSITLKRHYFV